MKTDNREVEIYIYTFNTLKQRSKLTIKYTYFEYVNSKIIFLPICVLFSALYYQALSLKQTSFKTILRYSLLIYFQFHKLCD